MRRAVGWEADALRKALPKPPMHPKIASLVANLNTELESIIRSYRTELVRRAARRGILKRFR